MALIFFSGQHLFSFTSDWFREEFGQRLRHMLLATSSLRDATSHLCSLSLREKARTVQMVSLPDGQEKSHLLLQVNYLF